MYFNSRSLLPKIDELRLLCDTVRPDILCVVETWLCNDISDCKVAIPNYTVTRFDRNRHGGGIAFYVRSCLCSEVLLKCPFDLEFALFSVASLNSSYKVHIGLFYRPPNSTVDVFDSLHTCLHDANVYSFSDLYY